MEVRKTNGTVEEFDKEKLMRGIREAYRGTGQTAPEEVVVSITDNLYIYDKITSQEIRRLVSCPRMSWGSTTVYRKSSSSSQAIRPSCKSSCSRG